jgi:hypothetical protein
MPMHRTVTASRTAAAVLFTAVVSVVGVFGVSAWAVTLVPLKGQSPEQMAVDQQECASQATAQTGYNPSAPPPTTSAAQPERGQRLAGAARGAAAGKVVSNITKESEPSEATEAGAKLGAMKGGCSAASEPTGAAPAGRTAAGARATAGIGLRRRTVGVPAIPRLLPPVAPIAATANGPGSVILFQVVAIQASERWTWEMRELFDVAVEGIGDAAHVSPDAKGG